MEISAAIVDSSALALAKSLLPRHSAAVLSAIHPIDSASPPAAVRSDPYRFSSAPRALVRRTRRTRRRSLVDDAGEDDAFSGDGGGDDDGAFGGGGRGWGSGRPDGGSGWEGSEPSHPRFSPDPAFDFIYKVLCWIALSNCAHFAIRRVGRLLSDREKVVPVRLVPSVC